MLITLMAVVTFWSIMIMVLCARWQSQRENSIAVQPTAPLPKATSIPIEEALGSESRIKFRCVGDLIRQHKEREEPVDYPRYRDTASYSPIYKTSMQHSFRTLHNWDDGPE